MATIKKAQKGAKMVPGEMTGKMYKKSELDKIGDKQAKELDKSGVFGKNAMAKKKVVKKAQNGIAEKLLAKGQERREKGTLLREGQRERLTRISEKNPDRAMKVADRMVKRAKSKMKNGGTVSMQLGSYKNVIGKNTKGKATKAVGLTKAKYGKSMGKCKNGC